MSHTKRSMVRTAITLGIMGMSCSAVSAQRAPQTKEGASIVVDGIVREVFRSPRQTQVDYVIQIEVSRSEYGRSPADPKRVQAPAPGDQIYVHVFQPSPEHQGRAGASGHSAIPTEKSQIRAYLYPGRRAAGKERSPTGSTRPAWLPRTVSPMNPSVPPRLLLARHPQRHPRLRRRRGPGR